MARPHNTQWELLNYLKALGFPVSDKIKLCDTLDEAIKTCIQGGIERDNYPFEIDGMVIKLNDLALADSLGIAGKDPRGAIAFKFPAREVSTRLLEIRVNVGRTGVLTPYAVLEAVEVGGVVVRQATLHNFDYIQEKDIRVGDRIMIKRAGDVIPYVIGPIVDVRTGQEQVYVPPVTCPDCGEKVEQLPGEVARYCVNASCPAQLGAKPGAFCIPGSHGNHRDGNKDCGAIGGSWISKRPGGYFFTHKRKFINSRRICRKKSSQSDRIDSILEKSLFSQIN